MNFTQIQRRRQYFLKIRQIFIIFLKKFYGFNLLSLGIFFYLSWISYDSLDPSWNTSVASSIQNFAGKWGAICADLMHQFFGKASLVIPLVFTCNGLLIIFSQNKHSLKRGILTLPLIQILVSCLWAHLSLPENQTINGGVFAVISLKYIQHYILILQNFTSVEQISNPFTLTIFLILLCSFIMPLSLNLTFEDWRTFLRNIYISFLRFIYFIENFFETLLIFKKFFSENFFKIKQKFDFQSSDRTINLKHAEKNEPLLTSLPQVSSSLKNKEKLEVTKDEIEENISQVLSPVTKNPSPSSTDFVHKIKIISPVSITPSKIEDSDKKELDLQSFYQLPTLDLLNLPEPGSHDSGLSEAVLMDNAKMLSTVLEDFGIQGEIKKVHPGPVVTLYELIPAPGIKASRIIGLADDIARSMSALSTRIAVIPGHNAIGIELPNKIRQTVYFRELLTSRDYEISGPKLPLALGKDIGGEPVIVDLARMPHLLVAGTTGSGKSVAINTMILSLLYRLSPDHCRFIMIDPKMLELSVYDGIPHLLSPVVTEPKKAVFALKWTVKEMEDRYRAMSKLGVRNIEGYNTRLAQAKASGEELTRQIQTGFDNDTGKPIFEIQPLDMTLLPYIVVIVDEMADLMLVAGKDIETTVQRLAQMARAAGIHLIMATQRPSVDVITGTIKANFPTRISFQVTSRFDSRTILSEQGAEQLLGRGDMLYMEPGGKIQRVHGPFATDTEVENVVKFLKSQGEPDYKETITEEDTDVSMGSFNEGEKGSKENELYQQAVQLVQRERKASTSFIQRHLRIGYNNAARIMEQLESQGIVSAANHVGKREVLT